LQEGGVKAGIESADEGGNRAEIGKPGESGGGVEDPSRAVGVAEFFEG
jgi:hypothetical protein